MGDLELNMNVDCILGNKVAPIEDSYNKTESYQTVVERYFTIRYIVDVGCILGDYSVLFHSNRICVITLAPSHRLIKEGMKIVKTDFDVDANSDRRKNKGYVTTKRGAKIIREAATFLFEVECADGSVLEVCACIPGRLIEINKEIRKDPNIITTDPYGKGFIACIMPSLGDYERYKKELLTLEQYKKQRDKAEANSSPHSTYNSSLN